MQLNAKETTIIKSLLKIVKFVDGDGIILEDFVSKKEFEVRLYGIDAPEINYCNKIKKDEKELKFFIGNNEVISLLLALGKWSVIAWDERINAGNGIAVIGYQPKLALYRRGANGKSHFSIGH